MKEEVAYFKADKQNQLNELNGIDMTIAKDSSFAVNPKDSYPAHVEDSTGKTVLAKTLDEAIIDADTYIYDDFDGDGNYDDFCSKNGWDKVCGDGKGDIDNDVDGDGVIDRKVWNGGKDNWIDYNDKDLDNDGTPNDIDKSRLVDFGKVIVSYIDYDHELISSKTTYKATTATQAYTKIYVAPVKNGITLSEYNKIKKGMTYQQVVKIIGENGKLESSASGYGTTIKIYSWNQKSTYGSASILFENSRVDSKAQAGLR